MTVIIMIKNIWININTQIISHNRNKSAGSHIIKSIISHEIKLI